MQTKDIPGFTGYKINENGEVFSYKGKKTRGHKMATVVTNCGYVHVSLVRHKKRWTHLWESHFSGMTAQTSNKFVGKFAHIAEAIVHTAYTDTFRSNADIGAEFDCDASMICHIRNNSNRCPKYFKPFILNYL